MKIIFEETDKVIIGALCNTQDCEISEDNAISVIEDYINSMIYLQTKKEREAAEEPIEKISITKGAI